jgi:hypothetical protein
MVLVTTQVVYFIEMARFFQTNDDSVLAWRRSQMFLGHYAVGLASKKLAPRASLGALVAAPILLDLLWPIFLLLGWEHVAIEPGSNPFLRLDFISFPISHGLVAVVGWATLYASLYFGFARYVSGAIVIWIGVISHWLLDYIVHRRDLALYAGGRMVGLGLWNYRWATIVLELGLFAVGIWIYLRQTKAKDKIGNYALWAFIGFLLLAYAGAAFGPPPRSVKMIAVGTLFSWLLIPWAWWFDQHRELCEATSEPSPRKVTLAGG